jgi:hypothetical protein
MKRFWIWMMTALMLSFLVACNSEQLVNPDENSDEEISLDKAFGGYDTDDEAAAFGESDLVTDFPEDAEVADSFSDDPAVVAELNSATTKVYFLRIIWGYLEGDSTAAEVTDWSGSAQINKGALLLLKTIRFENNDHINLPRPDRQTIEFTSFTKPHFDGLALAIIDNDTTQPEVEGTFTFNAGGYSKVLSFSELDSLELIEPVGADGQEVSIVSRSKEVSPFDGGFFAGRWVKTGPNGGEFRGRWINSLGTNAGYLKGIWGVNRNGNRVFFGKYISLNGEFRGLLEGQWQFNRGEQGGVFRGRWVDSGLQTAGTLGGHFKTGRPDDRRGYFQGRYKHGNPQNTDGSN